MSERFDFLIVGAGILGLSVARTLQRRYPDQRIAIIEKEPGLGLHGSGRNSGVLHSGIYYPEKSLKAKFSAQGARMLAEFCHEYRLPLARIGKVILPTVTEDDQTLDLLIQRGKANGAESYIVDNQQLAEIEPLARSASNRAVHVPGCSVIEPKLILATLAQQLQERGVKIFYGEELVRFNPAAGETKTRNGQRFEFGHMVNAAGLSADRVAHACNLGHNYTIMPFKGLYYDLRSETKNKIRGLIYPAPDLRLPFLGVHFTKSVSGGVYVGPNALPAMGRTNYTGVQGVRLSEIPGILSRNLRQYLKNEQGFRRLVHDELNRLRKGPFVRAAQALVPTVNGEELTRSQKVGIRAQLYDKREKKLVMDFLVEKAPRSTHILNAISPGFTCGPSFAEYVVSEFVEAST